VIKTVTYTAHKRLKDVATIWVLTAFAIGALPRTRYGSLQRSPVYPRPPSLIWEGERTREGKGGKGLRKKSGGKKRTGWEERGKGGREGKIKPLPNKNSGYSRVLAYLWCQYSVPVQSVRVEKHCIQITIYGQIEQYVFWNRIDSIRNSNRFVSRVGMHQLHLLVYLLTATCFVEFSILSVFQHNHKSTVRISGLRFWVSSLLHLSRKERNDSSSYDCEITRGT